MVVNVVTIIALLLFFLGVILIFNARWIVKNKLKNKNENMAVNMLKIFGLLISILALVLIYYFR